MRKNAVRSLVTLVLVIALTGCSASKKEVAPVNVPNSSTPSASAPSGSAPRTGAPGTIPGDQAALQAALAENSAIRYEVVLVEDTGARDKDAYLDWYTAEKKWPESSSLVLMVYAKDNYDLRFAMGAAFFEKQVTVDEMLALTRNAYFPKGSKGDPAGGLADLIRAVNQRMAR